MKLCGWTFTLRFTDLKRSVYISRYISIYISLKDLYDLWTYCYISISEWSVYISRYISIYLSLCKSLELWYFHTWLLWKLLVGSVQCCFPFCLLWKHKNINIYLFSLCFSFFLYMSICMYAYIWVVSWQRCPPFEADVQFALATTRAPNWLSMMGWPGAIIKLL